jgi:protein-tyrosine phosphatase
VIDLHCHLCFACDDGPRDAAEAAALARALVAAGTTTVACTSHVRPDKGWANGPAVQEPHARALDAALAGVPLARVAAAEHSLDAAVLDGVVPYGTSRWLLVELPYQGPPPDLFAALYGIRRRGYRVLLAHLERYPWAVDKDGKSDVVQRLVDAGHLVQVNLGSLAGGYAKEHKKLAERLVVDGFASVLAGDCHRADDVPRFVERGLQAARKLVGAATVERMTTTNPAAILDDQPPERIWPS